MFSNLTASSTYLKCLVNTAILLQMKTTDEMAVAEKALRENKRFIHEKIKMAADTDPSVCLMRRKPWGKERESVGCRRAELEIRGDNTQQTTQMSVSKEKQRLVYVHTGI